MSRHNVLPDSLSLAEQELLVEQLAQEFLFRVVIRGSVIRRSPASKGNEHE